MTLAMKAADDTHVFWLFNWGYHRVHRTLQLVPHYQRCDVTKEALTIYDAEIMVVVALADIERYNLQRFYEGAGGGHTTNLRLLLTKGGQRSGRRRNREAKQLCLLTADVFYHHSDGNWELKHLYEVIRCRKNREEPNPYHRMLLRRGQVERLTERVWDPYLHPSHYGRVPTMMGILTRMVFGMIGLSFLCAIVIGIIYYIVTTFF